MITWHVNSSHQKANIFSWPQKFDPFTAAMYHTAFKSLVKSHSIVKAQQTRSFKSALHIFHSVTKWWRSKMPKRMQKEAEKWLRRSEIKPTKRILQIKKRHTNSTFVKEPITYLYIQRCIRNAHGRTHARTFTQTHRGTHIIQQYLLIKITISKKKHEIKTQQIKRWLSYTAMYFSTQFSTSPFNSTNEKNSPLQIFAYGIFLFQ